MLKKSHLIPIHFPEEQVHRDQHPLPQLSSAYSPGDQTLCNLHFLGHFTSPKDALAYQFFESRKIIIFVLLFLWCRVAPTCGFVCYFAYVTCVYKKYLCNIVRRRMSSHVVDGTNRHLAKLTHFLVPQLSVYDENRQS